ncbi:MAG: VanZ family protein [Clostridiales bacterium]|nr:VanZ family protein [Clostridiales bacterium]
MFAFYLSFVLTITVIERIVTAKAKYELELFWTYKAIQAGQTDLRAEIFWNVVLFIPIGILVSMMLPKKRKWLSIIVGFLMSAGIELTQLLLHRGLFEFDDMVHNTLGTVIGLVLFLIVSGIVKAVRGRT